MSFRLLSSMRQHRRGRSVAASSYASSSSSDRMTTTKLCLLLLLLLFVVTYSSFSNCCCCQAWIVNDDGRRRGVRDGVSSFGWRHQPLASKRKESIPLEMCGMSDKASSNTTSSSNNHNVPFPALGQRPLLAVITAPDACDSPESMEVTWEALRQAVSTGMVDLVSIRLNNLSMDKDEGSSCTWERAVTLTKRLVELANKHSDDDDELSSRRPLFQVVCSSDLVSVAVEAHAHGVHIKEHHWQYQLPDIVAQFDYPILIGTSVHSLDAAAAKKDAVHGIQPQYYFVGTCYMTQSHPEKAAKDLEGPALPGKMKKALQTTATNANTIPIFAIGGIDDSNCHEPVALGADGVAVIRAVVQADDPAGAVRNILGNMMMQQGKEEGVQTTHTQK